MSNAATQIAVRRLGRRTVRACESRGIVFLSMSCAGGGDDNDLTNPIPLYVVSDNGTGRVWTADSVKAAANRAGGRRH